MVARAYGNVKTAFKKKRFAILFLSTYILIAALPILVFGLGLNQYLLGQFAKKIQERDLQMLRQFEAGAENYFQSLERVSTLIYMDPDLSAYRLMTSPLNAIEGIKFLRKYTISYSYIRHVLLYSYLEDRFYTSETAITADELFQTYTIKGLSADALGQLIDDQNAFYISPPYELKIALAYISYRIALVAIPQPPGIIRNEQKVFFMIDLSVLDTLLSSGGQSMLLFTADGHLLSPDPSSSAFTDYAEEINQAIQQDNTQRTLSLGGREYDMQSIISENTGLRYVSLVDRAVARAEVNAIREVLLVVISIMTVILVVIIVIGKQLHLNPLQALFDRAQRVAGRSPDQPVGYQTVSSAFDYMIDQQATMKTKYDSARTAIREHLLIQLLGNEIASIAEFNELGRDVGLSFSHDSFCIAVLRLDTDDLRTNRQLIAIQMEPSGGTVEGYTLQMPDDRIVGFYCLDFASVDLEPDYFMHIREYLLKQGLAVDIGVGNTYPDIGQIAESYSEALAALDYQSVRGSGVLFFRVETGNTDWFDLEYPTKKIQLLEALLLEGDTDKISSTVNEISEFMDRQNLPLSAVRCLNYDIINTLLKTMRVISRKYAPMKDKILDIMALSGFNSSEDLRLETQRICLEICEHIRKTNESRIDNLAIRILEYVNQNYCSTNFSICTMANDLDLSLSLVNTCFKKFMDKTPLEYVNEMRLNLAKHLLATTSLSLNDITRQVGYIDTPSFLRKFHKLTGITPGQFRKLHAGQPDGDSEK